MRNIIAYDTYAVMKRYYDSLCYDMVTEKTLGCFMNVVHK